MSQLSQGPSFTKEIHVDVLAGHLGHLTEEQQKAFAAFKERLAQQKLYIPSFTSDDQLPSHDEPTLLLVSWIQFTFKQWLADRLTILLVDF